MSAVIPVTFLKVDRLRRQQHYYTDFPFRVSLFAARSLSSAIAVRPPMANALPFFLFSFPSFYSPPDSQVPRLPNAGQRNLVPFHIYAMGMNLFDYVRVVWGKSERFVPEIKEDFFFKFISSHYKINIIFSSIST